MGLVLMDAFCRHLDKEGVKYTVARENAVRIGYNCDNIPSCSITVVFDKDGGHTVAFKSWDIGSFKDESKYAKGLITCNAMNARFRWAKFYLDDDSDIAVESDAIVNEATVGPVCREMVLRLIGIIDDAYPEFMKARWN